MIEWAIHFWHKVFGGECYCSDCFCEIMFKLFDVDREISKMKLERRSR